MTEDYTLFSKFGAFLEEENKEKPKIESKEIIIIEKIETPSIKPKTLIFDEENSNDINFDYKATIISKEEEKPIIKKYVREKLPCITLDTLIDDEPIKKSIIEEKPIEKPIIQEKIIEEKPIEKIIEKTIIQEKPVNDEKLDFTWKFLIKYCRVRRKILG